MIATEVILNKNIYCHKLNTELILSVSLRLQSIFIAHDSAMQTEYRRCSFCLDALVLSNEIWNERVFRLALIDQT